MATNARSSVDCEFVIGNRAQELFVAIIGICDKHLKTAGFELKIESYRKNNKNKERATICREHSAS